MMYLSVRKATATLFVIVATAALIAAGCASGGGSATGLQFVPSNTIAYVVVDTNFEGANWKKAVKLLNAFPNYEKQRDKQLGKLAKKKHGFKYGKDVKPWLGDQGGVAVLAGGGTVGWLETTDEAKATKFFNSRSKSKKKKAYKGVDIITSKTYTGSTNIWAIKDGIVLFSDKASDIKKSIAANDSGKTLDDSGAVKKLADHAGSKALATVVVNGAAARKMLTSSALGLTKYKSIAKLPQVAAFNGAEFDVSAESSGFRAKAYVDFNKKKLGKVSFKADAFEPTLINSLPAATIGLFTGNNIGKTLNGSITQAKAMPNVGTMVTRLEQLYGVSGNDLEKALQGQYAFAATASETGTPGIGLLFESSDATATGGLLESLMNILKTQTGQAPTTAKVGDSEVSSIVVGKDRIVETAVIGDNGVVGVKPFAETIAQTSGDVSLGTDSDFKSAWDAAGVPDKVSGAIFVNPGLAAMGILGASQAGVASSPMAGDIKALGPWVGWLDMDDSTISMNVYMAINT